MKLNKFTTLLCIFPWTMSVSLWAQSGTIILNNTGYPIDTIDHYQIGPGVEYTHFTIAYSSLRTCHFYLLSADLTNPYNTVREYQPIFKSQATIAKAYQEMNAPGYRPIGGVNCNFWQVSASTNDLSGMPQSATASGGHLNTEPSSWILGEWHQEGVPSDDPAKDQGLVMFDELGRCIIDSVYWQGYVFYGDNQRRKIREVNRPRINPNNNEIELFTPFLGSFKTRKPSEFTTDNGYGVYNVITRVDQWSINDTLEAIVESIDSVGGLTVGEGHAIFQGRGTGKETLQTFRIGDTIRFCLGIKTRRDGLRPHIMEMCTGNALVMENGELNQRNYNDAYNYKQYARTGIATNATGDKLWLMTCQTPGVYTHEMCYIFQHLGATEVAACDGGGSAQCAVYDQVMNPTTEATPRAVVNQLWLISTAPDSDIPGQLQFVNPLASVPAYASYTPTLRAWTAEGMLLSHDYKGYTLSCEPASLGTISADGLTFTANPVNAAGKLIATAGTGRVETPIEIRDGKVSIVLDSVILGNRDYKVDVQAIAGGLALPLDAKALTWESKDESRCTVSDEGILHAVADGRTQIIGSLAEFSDTLQVITEMADAPQRSFLNSQLSIDTSFTSTRTAAIILPLDIRLFGTPDTILMVINTDAPVQALEVTYQNDNKYKLTGSTTANTDYTFTLPVDKLFETVEQSIYPITLQEAKFSLKDPKSKKTYHLDIKDIILCYRDWAEVTADPSLTLPSKGRECKIMVNGQMYILKNNHIYNIKGHEIK